MSHESIVFGYIESPTYTVDEYRKYQKENIDYLESLSSEFDEYPAFSKGMFSWSPFEPRKGCFRSHVIHFGGSYKNIDYGYSEIGILIGEFENILKNLFWFDSSIFVHIELVGDLRFDYVATEEIAESYRVKNPRPTESWRRKYFENGKPSDFEPEQERAHNS